VPTDTPLPTEARPTDTAVTEDLSTARRLSE
jgi:hypothetical protein